MTTIITTPVGRLVQGHPMELQDKDAQGNPRVVKTGPNAGQPSPQCYVGVAFSKQDPMWPAVYAAIVAEAKLGFPHLFDAQGNCTHPKFAFKIIDGDGIDDNGKPNNTKEGFAGHWVLKASSGFLPQCYHAGHYQPHEQIQDKMAIRRGDYVRLQIKLEPNGNAQRPGVYVTPTMVELSGKGIEIVTGPSAADAFATPPQLPAGASPTPMMIPPAAASAVPPANPPMPAPTVGVPAGTTPASVAAVAPGSIPTTSPSNPVLAPHTSYMAPPPAPVAFPPAGWTAHPSAPGYYYMGQEVLAEADLRARVGA